MKKIIRLTESQLIKFIEKSVNKLLKEQSGDIQVYSYPNDTRWVYSVQNQKWFASKNVEPYNWININDNPKYERSVQKLDKQFPNARNHQQVSGIPLKNTGENPKYNFKQDSEIANELPTPGFKDPNRFNSNKQMTANEQQISGVPLKSTPSYKKSTFKKDMESSTELPTPGFKDPNRFNSNAEKPTKVPFRR